MTVKPTIGANRINGDIVTATDWNRDVGQEGNWAQEVLAGSNSDKIPLAALAGVTGFYPNLLVNGGFEVAQRGTGVFDTNVTQGQLTLDRWRIASSGGSRVQIQRSTAADGGSQYSGGCTYTHAGGGLGQVYQDMENFAALRNLPLVFSARVAVVGGRGYLQLFDGVSTTSSATSTANAYTYLSVALTTSGSATGVRCALVMDTASGTIYIDNAILTTGIAAPAYYPIHPADDLLRCQRYYQQVRASARWYPTTAAQTRGIVIPLPVEMPGAPNLATIAAGTGTNIASRAVNTTYTTAKSAVVQYTNTSANTDTSSYDDVVTLEYSSI